ncbi:hypothetical protein, partial [Treponema endosymbiont of Eucomonympha sp.]|uniref:hypothetical protein n=1 Tax=Treponema endosymbiont of Eucomonympha sp. TaxID=1580831 RepID=UPI001EE6DD55
MKDMNDTKQTAAQGSFRELPHAVSLTQTRGKYGYNTEAKTSLPSLPGTFGARQTRSFGEAERVCLRGRLSLRSMTMKKQNTR